MRLKSLYNQERIYSKLTHYLARFLVANRAAKFYIYGGGSVLQAEGHPFVPDTAHQKSSD